MQHLSNTVSKVIKQQLPVVQNPKVVLMYSSQQTCIWKIQFLSKSIIKNLDFNIFLTLGTTYKIITNDRKTYVTQGNGTAYNNQSVKGKTKQEMNWPIWIIGETMT